MLCDLEFIVRSSQRLQVHRTKALNLKNCISFDNLKELYDILSHLKL
jgi:hypothetical protein